MSDHEPAPDAAVAIAATFTVEPILPPLRFILREARLALALECAPYNQIFQELLSTTSLLATNTGGINVVLIRMEDFTRESDDLDAARALLARTTQELMEAFGQFARRAKSPTVLVVLDRSPEPAITLHHDLDGAAAALVAHVRSLAGIHVVSTAEIDDVAAGEKFDRLRDELAHIPFTEEFYASLAYCIGRRIHALRVPPHKVLVLDCDNTLWRGVIGEDGIDGVEITDSFLRVQRFAVEQQTKGILVCLASKNAERDVLDVFENRPDMVLKPEHIISHRINWKPKSENISSLAHELNLGLDSFVFLDDNPIECAQTRSALPQVVTLQIPPEKEIDDFLARLWVFDKVAITAEDSRRTSLYRENAARQQHEESATDISEFVASLELQIDISTPHDNEWPRVAQLTQRTNQFNFTTVRRTESDMRAAEIAGSLILRVNVRDRFGDYGLVGLMIVNSTETTLIVDTLLLSCRVLGRGVEHAMLRRLGELATQRGLAEVDLPYAPTPKNEPARAFADSVAAEYRIEDQIRTIYRIPAAYARGIAHRPGHDPEEVIKARKSEENKVAPADSPHTASSIASRSESYSKLALDYVSGRAIIDAMRAKDARVRTLRSPLEKPASETERALVSLWQELLNVDELGVEDDYFALGGTSLLAARMFAEITQRFAVKLRLTAILESPTVRSLARYIDGIERSGNFVELRRGGEQNLFLVHDGDGETLLYRNLARRMPGNVAVVGIEPRRIPKVPLAHTRIEDMARFYVAEVRRRQPTGPYMLGGLCAGGVIAYEMASQLKIAGERVRLVAILDAARPHALKRPGRLAAQRVNRLKLMLAGSGNTHISFFVRVYRVAKGAAAKLLGYLSWKLSSSAKRLSTRIRFRVLREVLGRGLPWPSFLTELSVREIYDSAEALYVPKSLSDPAVLLVRAQVGAGDDTPYCEIFSDDTFGWKSISPEIGVIDVKGGHSSMLQEPSVESLASALTRILTYEEPRFTNIASDVPLETIPTSINAIYSTIDTEPASAHRTESNLHRVTGKPA
jgi:FkbH-like protein